MTVLESWILQACDILGLEVDIPFVVDIGGDREIRAAVRIRGLGASNGMLVVRNYADIQLDVEALIEAGYGYSVLEEPRPDESFDLDSFKEMFLDWGWVGSISDCPQGLRG